MMNLKIKSYLWFSVATISCGMLAPLINQVHIYTKNIQIRDKAKEEQIETFKVVNLSQLDSLIAEETAFAEPSGFKTNLYSANLNANEYEVPANLDYQAEIKNNALKIINGEYLIIDLQEKFNQEYIGNEDKYASLLGGYTNTPVIESHSFSQVNYAYTTSTDESLSIADMYNLQNLDKILQNMKDYHIGVQVMAGVSTAATVVAWATAAFYWAAWWMFGANVPFAVAASIQAGFLTGTTYESWEEHRETARDIELLSQLSAYIDDDMKNKIDFLIDSYESMDGFINEVFEEVSQYLSQKILTWVSIKIYNTTFKKFSNYIIKKTNKFISKMVSSKIGILSTAWASPISAALGVIDTTISLYSIGLAYWKTTIF